MAAGNRQHQSGYARAAAEVGQGKGAGREQRQELDGIEDMAGPDLLGGRGSDQVDSLLPGEQQIDIGFQPLA